ELGESAPRPERWRELLESVELSALEELARALSRLPAAPEPDDEAAARSLEALAAGVAGLAEGRPKPRGKILEYLPRLAQRLRETARAARGAQPRVLDPLGSRPKWPAAWASEGEDAFAAAAAAGERVDPAAEALHKKAFALLEPFARRVRELHARRGWVSFDGLLRRARDLVRDRRAAREALKRRFGAILVDEFQDTDPLQGELLLLLAEKPGTCERDWRRSTPQPGKLFVVGDPKQSIYRFRGADIAAVEAFTGHLAAHGALACSLRANFRSAGAVVSAVNAVFERAMTARPGLQPAYAPIIPAAASADDAAVERYAVDDENAGADERRAREAAWIADWIARRRGGRAYKDVAVLLRGTGSLRIYLDALRRAGIPYAVEGERSFFGTQEAADFLNLLRAADDPRDRAALAGLLRSPAALVPDRDLCAMAEKGLLDYEKEPPPGLGLERLYAALRAARAAAGREPLGEVVDLLLRGSALVERACAAYHGQQTASNLFKLRRMAAAAGEKGRTLKEFAAEVSASLRELREEGESPLADEDYDAVRVLTIHKSKGLEYPVVIIPDLARTPAGGPGKAAVLQSWGGAGGSLVGLRLGRSGGANAAMAILEEEEARRQREEEVRVLYVAMTRAKSRLILLGAGARKGSLAEILDGAGAPLLGPLPALPEADAARGEARSPSGADPERLRALWKARAERRERAEASPLFLRPSDSPAGERMSHIATGTAPRARGAAACLGTLCHAVLERWDYGTPGASPEPLLGQTLRDARAAEPEEPWEDAARPALELLRSFLSSEAARRLGSVEIVGRELPFTHAEGEAVARGAIDLLYRESGRLVVADYKTEAPPRPGEPDRHAPQLEAYARAVRRALPGTEVVCRTIYLRAP
ncbi:MAG TPA: 3'-5' exonuclease, partial [Elusimicrobiota bacterium]|nr:3'-5' exonuclease [Elusimicrobiota bacterium]